MKKVGQIVLIFLFICVIYQLGILFFVKNYNYSYKYKVDKKTYQITEEYKLSGKEHLYNIEVADEKGNIYTFLVNHNFHKEKEILDDLLVYSQDDLTCVFPVFKDNVYSNIECSTNKKTVSYDYLKQSNDLRIDNFIDIIRKKGYDIKAWSNNSSFKEIAGNNTKISYYTDFIDNYNIIVWKYNGVYSINKSEQKINDFLTYDVYDSKYRISTDKSLYVMDIEEGNESFDKIYMVNSSDGKMRFIDVLDDNISSNSYFNGIYNNNVYMLDCNSNIQYKINEDNEKIEKSSKNNMIKYFDGKKLTNMKVDSIKNSNIKFYQNVINDDITKLYKTKDIRISNGHYYFRTSDGNMYMSLGKDYKQVVLLFTMENFKEWIVVDDTIFGIGGDLLYAYNDLYGLKPIIKYNEFNYHTDNMYGVAKK